MQTQGNWCIWDTSEQLHTWNTDNLFVRKVRPAAHVPLSPGLVEPRRFWVHAQSPISARVLWGQCALSSGCTRSFGGLHKSRGRIQSCDIPAACPEQSGFGDPQILGKESKPSKRPCTGKFERRQAKLWAVDPQTGGVGMQFCKSHL